MRSREIAELFESHTAPKVEGGKGMPGDGAVKRIAEELEIRGVTVNVNLPYQNVVYNLEYVCRDRNYIYMGIRPHSCLTRTVPQPSTVFLEK